MQSQSLSFLWLHSFYIFCLFCKLPSCSVFHIHTYTHRHTFLSNARLSANPIRSRNVAPWPPNPDPSQHFRRRDNEFCLESCACKAYCLYAVDCWSCLSSLVTHPPCHSHYFFYFFGLLSICSKTQTYKPRSRVGTQTETHTSEW